MPSRVIAFFLALILLWSSLSTIEVPRVFTPSSPEQQHAIAHAGGPAATLEGSVERHHLDDLPLHAQNEPPTETPDPLLEELKAIIPWPGMVQLPVFVAAAGGSPFLPGLLRPPCGAAVSV